MHDCDHKDEPVPEAFQREDQCTDRLNDFRSSRREEDKRIPGNRPCAGLDLNSYFVPEDFASRAVVCIQSGDSNEGSIRPRAIQPMKNFRDVLGRIAAAACTILCASALFVCRAVANSTAMLSNLRAGAFLEFLP